VRLAIDFELITGHGMLVLFSQKNRALKLLQCANKSMNILTAGKLKECTRENRKSAELAASTLQQRKKIRWI
jgi:hypothetical protein